MTGTSLDLAALSHSGLTAQRADLLDRVIALAADEDGAMRALKLGPRQTAEVERNRDCATRRRCPRSTATPACSSTRSTHRASRPTRDRSRGARCVVHSALFGLVGALDPIPAYRLSHDSRVPGVRLRAFWRAPLAERLASEDGVIVDLRSEGYAELGPAPARDDSVFVRVVSVGDDGRRRALNHFNKHAKGRFTRAVLDSRPDVTSLDDLRRVGAGSRASWSICDRRPRRVRRASSSSSPDAPSARPRVRCTASPRRVQALAPARSARSSAVTARKQPAR